MTEKKVLFSLKRWWPPGFPREEQYDLYEAIKEGTKTAEYRDVTPYWTSRLFTKGRPKTRAWFMVGFPKNCLPRLEADITKILVDEDQYEIQFENVVEVLE